MEAVGLTVSDVDGDGLLDLVTTMETPVVGSACLESAVVVLLGEGNGSFRKRLEATLLESCPTATAMVRRAGQTERLLVVAGSHGNRVGGAFNVRLLRPGETSLQEDDRVFPSLRVGSAAWWGQDLLATDLDRDGDDEILVLAPGHVVSLRMDGARLTQAALPADVPLGRHASAVAADFNDDGFPDLTVTNTTEECTNLLLLGRAGTFTRAGSIPWGPGATAPAQLLAVDLNGAGRADVRTLHAGDRDVYAANAVEVLHLSAEGNVTGEVVTRTDHFSQPDHPLRKVAAGDLDRDGRPEIVLAGPRGPRGLLLLRGSCHEALTGRPHDRSAPGGPRASGLIHTKAP
jgi:hypothetical protein